MKNNETNPKVAVDTDSSRDIGAGISMRSGVTDEPGRRLQPTGVRTALITGASGGTCAIPGKTFIWLPFVGGISAFAVILPKTHEEL